MQARKHLDVNHKLTFFFWLRQDLKESLCPCVCLSGTSLSKALNLHLSLIGLSQVSLRSVSGQSQVSLRSVSCQSQVSLRSVSGQSQVSPRSLLGLSELTSSRRSLKYFVLLNCSCKIFRNYTGYNKKKWFLQDDPRV